MRIILRRAFLTLALLLLLVCPARAAGGLDSFPDQKAMDGATFSDVAPHHWFYTGVKAAYDMSIMDGIGGGKFAPEQTVPWSQAVTIAARVRSAYLGQTIPESDGAWYQKYVDYAAACAILPPNHPEGDAWNTQPIDRQSIAYLFQAVVDEDDCPAISDLDIPDLDAADTDKRDAVRTLYAAGIFTGKDGGFDPTGLTTRAELSTILSRLLRPAYRVAHDSRLNPDMEGQWSNFFHDGGLCYDEDAVYLIYRESNSSDPQCQHILRRDKETGEVTTLYSTPGEKWSNLKNLALWDSCLYFVEKVANYDCVLRRLDLSTGTVDTLCSTPKDNDLGYFHIYDGRIFTLQCRMTASADFIYTLGEVSGGSIRSLGTYNDVNSLYAFNGKLYITADYGDTIHSYDLTSGAKDVCLENVEAHLFDGGTLYFLLWDNGGYSHQVWMASLEDPDRPVKYGTVPESALAHYVHLAHDGADLYYIASSTSTLYRIVPDQVAEKVHTTRWATVEDPIFWDGCVLEGNPGLYVGGNYIGEYPVVTDFGTPRQQRTNVDEWLGRSAMMMRTSFPQEGRAYTNDDPLDENNNTSVRRAYYSDGRLVLDVDYYNPDTDKIRAILQMEVTLKAGDVLLAENVRVVNTDDAKPGRTLHLTVVIQGEDLLVDNADLSDLNWEFKTAYRLYNP